MNGINVTVPTTEEYQLKQESWGGGCVLCGECASWRQGKHMSNYGKCKYHEENDDDEMLVHAPDFYPHKNFGCVLGERKPIPETQEQEIEVSR